MKGPLLKLSLAAILAAGFISSCSGEADKGGKGQSSTGKGDEVRREVGEALEATKDYLSESTDKLKARYDDQIKSIDEGVEELRRSAADAGEKGREYRDRALRILEDKKAAAGERMEDLQGSSGEFRREAGEKLDAAMRELQEAYERARRSFENGGQ